MIGRWQHASTKLQLFSSWRPHCRFFWFVIAQQKIQPHLAGLPATKSSTVKGCSGCGSVRHAARSAADMLCGTCPAAPPRCLAAARRLNAGAPYSSRHTPAPNCATDENAYSRKVMMCNGTDVDRERGQRTSKRWPGSSGGARPECAATSLSDGSRSCSFGHRLNVGPSPCAVNELLV